MSSVIYRMSAQTKGHMEFICYTLLLAFKNAKTSRLSEIKQTRPSTKQDFSGEALSKQNTEASLASLSWLVPGDDRVVRHICIRCMEHAGEENSTWVFRFRVAQVCSLTSLHFTCPQAPRWRICSLSFQIKFGNALQNPLNWPLRDIETKSTSTVMFTFRLEKSLNFSLYKQGTDARRLHYFYGLLFKNKG